MKDLKMYINGKFVESRSGKWIEVLNPSTEEVTSRQPDGTVEDVAEAIDAAVKAQKEWAKIPACERAVYLHKLADGIRANFDKFQEILVREQGKTQALAATEVGVTATYFDYMAEFARRIEGEIIQSDAPNETMMLFKKPIGVAAGILPWNFPFFLIARKAGAALMAGCSIVIKPSQLTPENCCEFCKIVDEVGLPAGVFNVVTGKGSVVGNAMASSPKVGIVSLTGSVGAGTQIMEAAAPNITKVSLELGGKAPAIVFPDADLELAAQAILESRIGNSGQICNNAERVYVHKDIKEEFTKLIVKKFQAVKVGNPAIVKDADMGPLVEKRALESVMAKVDHAVEQGAKILCGGHRVGDKGYFYEATVLDNVKQDFDIVHEETFGPVLPLIEFDNIDQVIEWANDVEYGLASSVFTKDIDTATRICREIEFGETYINRMHFEAIQGFHAGVKKSGIGGADGKHGLEEYLVTHVVYLDTHYHH
ncbi:MAG: aldehyde dehydrogenase [Phocaeicola sp.]|jgi:lactaldehyde dehydrogenase/glycolaldehyde dehydrogenase|nr:aldehyde dehydrogenase [Phocaeicola sp.]MBR1595777.1 aldehyde dehydrogenase [Phocaeicola sp.]MBR1718801.1 aldehyde dehydrogenase [Phocaeicola sp.]